MADDFDARTASPFASAGGDSASPWAVDPERLAALVEQYPDLNPDAAVGGVSSGADLSPDREAYIQAVRQQMIQDNIEQAQAAAKANEDWWVGVPRVMTQVAGAALEAPWQIVMNAVRVQEAKQAGGDPGMEGPLGYASSILGNTDFNYILQGADPGSAWFGPAEDSEAVQLKMAEDRNQAGQFSTDPTAVKDIPVTVGQRRTTWLPEGSAIHSMVSGFIDLSTRVADPSLAVGGGEVKAGLKALQFGNESELAAKGLNAARQVRSGSDAAEALAASEARVAEHDAQLAAVGESNAALHANMARLQEELVGRQQGVIADARASAARAQLEHDTVLQQTADARLTDDLTGWETQKFDSEQELAQARAERAREARKQGRVVRKAQADADAAEAKADLPPVPEGVTISPADTVTIKPKPDRQGGLPTYEHVEAGVEGSGTLHRVVAHDAEGNRVGELFWDPESGLIEHIAVDPSAQGAGLGRNLLAEARRTAEERGWKAPEHATRPEDLTEAGAAFKASDLNTARAGEKEAARAALDEAQNKLAWLKQMYGDEVSSLAAHDKDLAAALELVSGKTAELSGKRAEELLEAADELERKVYLKHQKKAAQIQRRIEANDQAIAMIKEAREAERRVGLAYVNEAAARHGRAGARDLDEAQAVIHDLMGMTPEGQVDFDKWLRFATSSDAEPFLRMLVDIDDPAMLARLTRGKLSVGTQRRILAAKNLDEARAAIAYGATEGELANLGRMTSLRAAARDAVGAEPSRMIRAYNKAFGTKVPKLASYARSLAQSNVPWATAVNINDEDAMVRLVMDTGNFMGKLWRKELGGGPVRELTDRVIAEQIAATTAKARRTSWENFNGELLTLAAKQHGLGEEDLKLLKDFLRKSDDKARADTVYTAEARAQSATKKVYINGKELRDMATLEAEMSDLVTSPDWKLVQRLMNSQREMKRTLEHAQNGMSTENAIDFYHKATEALFEKYWRASVLAFRGGYVLRNIGDIQVRMMFNSHPSMFNAPVNILAMALAHADEPGKLQGVGRLINDAGRTAKYDANGRLMTRDAVRDVQGEWDAYDGWVEQQLRGHSGWDPGAPGAASYADAGVKHVDPTEPEFYRGWAKELGLLYHSPMAKAVFDIETGRPPAWLLGHMRKTGIMDQREALVDYLWSGKGRKKLDEFLAEGQQMRKVITSREDLAAHLWGDDPINLVTRFRRLTDDYNPNVVAALEDLATATRGDRSYLSKQLRLAVPRNELNARLADGTWNIDQVRVVGGDSTLKDRGKFLNTAVDWFFAQSLKGEKQLGYLPEYQFAKHDAMAKLLSALSPEDAATVVANVRKGLEGSALPMSWRSKTLRTYERNAARATGDGSFSIEDLMHIGDRMAAEDVRRLFYDATQRNATAHALRLISPFAQAFVNTMRVWGRLAAADSNRLYAVEQLYRAGQGPGTAWFSDDPTNPEDAMFAPDPNTGQMMIHIPLVNQALSSLSGAIAQLRGAPSGVDVAGGMPVQSFNLAFQNGISPGFGPAIVIPVSALESQDWYQKYTPDFVKRAVVPYVNSDPERNQNLMTMMTPAWASDILAAGGVPGYTDRLQKYMGPAMAALWSKNPGRYTDSSGLMTEQGQRQLAEDAWNVASGLGFAKGVMQNSSAGSLLPQIMVEDKAGNTLAPYVITQEFYDIANRTGSREQAMSQLIDKYGINVLMTLLPMRSSSVTASKDAYDFALGNPEELDQYGTVLGLLYPGGGYSAYYDRWLRQSGKNKSLSPDEMVDASNGLLREAQDSENDRKLAAGLVDQLTWQETHDAIAAAYKVHPQASHTTNSRDVTIDQLTKAVADPALKDAPALFSLSTYLLLRQRAMARAEGGTLSGQGDAELRAWLRSKGEQLAADDPSFTVAWLKVFQGEVSD